MHAYLHKAHAFVKMLYTSYCILQHKNLQRIVCVHVYSNSSVFVCVRVHVRVCAL